MVFTTRNKTSKLLVLNGPLCLSKQLSVVEEDLTHGLWKEVFYDCKPN